MPQEIPVDSSLINRQVAISQNEGHLINGHLDPNNSYDVAQKQSDHQQHTVDNTQQLDTNDINTSSTSVGSTNSTTTVKTPRRLAIRPATPNRNGGNNIQPATTPNGMAKKAFSELSKTPTSQGWEVSHGPTSSRSASTTPHKRKAQNSNSMTNQTPASRLASQQKSLQQTYTLSSPMSIYRKQNSPATHSLNQSDISTGLYTATYSDIDVFEMMVDGIAVMRRRGDSSLNATQILKVAGIDKSKRTKILEREILTGTHEKVQGGYGKYQGTWIPYERGVDLCKKYSVYDVLQPLLEFDTRNPAMENTPTKEQAMAARRKHSNQYHPLLLPPPSSSAVPFTHPLQVGSNYNTPLSQSASEALSTLGRAAKIDSQPLPYTGVFQVNDYYNNPNHPNSANRTFQSTPGSAYSGDQSQAQISFSMPANTHNNVLMTPVRGGSQYSDQEPSSKRQRMYHDAGATTTPSSSLNKPFPPDSNATVYQPDDEYEDIAIDESLIPASNVPLEPLNSSTANFESSKELITNIFLDNTARLVDAFGGDVKPPDITLDVPIDDLGHTALHWASALGRIPLVKELIKYGANRLRANYAGESALIRAVLVTNNADMHIFPQLLDLLYPTIPLLDKLGRNVLHHIALTAGIKGRTEASRYYLSSLLEWIVRKGSRGQPGSKLSLGSFIKNVVNSKDKNGDTALNIAARVGNRSIAQHLLKIGADATIPNRAGLRPTDFGIRINDPFSKNGHSHHDSDLTYNLPNFKLNGGDDSESKSPADGDEAQKTGLTMTDLELTEKSDAMIQDISNDVKVFLSESQACFRDEYDAKNDEFKQLHINLQKANKVLNDLQARVQHIKYIEQKMRNYETRSRNLERAVMEEDRKFQAEQESQGLSTMPISLDAKFDADQPFIVNFIYQVYDQMKKDKRILHLAPKDKDEKKTSPEPEQDIDLLTLKSASFRNQLKTELINAYKEKSPMVVSEFEHIPKAILKARVRAYRVNQERLENISRDLKSRSIDLEQRFRHVVSMCTGVEESQVDNLLDGLVEAVANDPKEVDMTRIADFLKKK